MESLSGQSFILSNLGRVDDEEMIPTARGLSHWRPTRFDNWQLNFPSLEGHLRDRAKDWFEIFGSALVQEKAADFSQLNETLAENLPAVRNRKNLDGKGIHAGKCGARELMRIRKDKIRICVGCLTTTTDREIGVMQKWWIDQMIGRTFIEILMRMVLRGTKGSKAGISSIDIIVGLIAIMEGVSLEIGVRVKILVEGG
ncbi:hypothetical protein TNCV_2414361 [Trichonephila clavipes]|nr:hypothetical protein TNCV_2414361 [Trichonephila clavipes]